MLPDPGLARKRSDRTKDRRYAQEADHTRQRPGRGQRQLPEEPTAPQPETAGGVHTGDRTRSEEEDRSQLQSGDEQCKRNHIQTLRPGITSRPQYAGRGGLAASGWWLFSRRSWPGRRRWTYLGCAMSRPAYSSLTAATLRERARQAIASLADCRACPRDCGVNRLEDRWAACKTGRHAVVSSCFPHLGEEDPLRGWNGSGTIFFSHCNLRCVFCQNYDISQAVKPGPARGSSPEAIAATMVELQRLGCHNINFVTPEHVVPQVLEALAPAVEGGLAIPIVYNTSAYDALQSLELLDGIVDIYMPDFKYWSADLSRRYLKAEDYPVAARAAIKEMHRQVGPLRIDANGLATRGLLIRHLVMPGGLNETRAILEWIARELGTDTYINLMDQYRPAGRVCADAYPEINRRVTSSEFDTAVEIALDLGLTRLDDRRLPRQRSGRIRPDRLE